VLYMVIERFRPGRAREVYERARRHGRQLPPGLEYIDSWVDLAHERCFQLMRTADERQIGIWVARWSDLVDFEVIPVESSAAAAAAVLGEP